MLNKFIKVGFESYEDKFSRVENLKKRFIEQGIPENISKYKAQEIVLTPDELVKIDLEANKGAGVYYAVNFFFKTREELDLVRKFFNFSVRQMAVKDSQLLIDILKLLEETNGKWKHKR